MEGWNPRTLVRYGYCHEHNVGNIVIIWNLSELDAALKGIESDNDAKEYPGEVSRGVANGEVE